MALLAGLVILTILLSQVMKGAQDFFKVGLPLLLFVLLIAFFPIFWPLIEI